VGVEEKHSVETAIARGMENAARAKPAAEVLRDDEIQNVIRRETRKIMEARQPWRTDRLTTFESADARPGERRRPAMIEERPSDRLTSWEHGAGKNGSEMRSANTVTKKKSTENPQLTSGRHRSQPGTVFGRLRIGGPSGDRRPKRRALQRETEWTKSTTATAT
jgi:hypothetical protein